MSDKKLRSYAPGIARIGVGVVFFLIGLSQLMNPQGWVSWLPIFARELFLSPVTLIVFNGVFDVVLGLLLISGLFVRIVSGIGILHLLVVIFSIGYNDIAIRDIGLLIVLVSVLVHGEDKLALHRKVFGKNQ